jgi:hypothetical protein
VNDDLSSGLKMTGNITIAAWIRLSTLGAQTIVQRWTSEGNNLSYALAIEPTDPENSIKLYLSSNGTSVTGYAFGATALSTDTWYHVAGVYNGTDVRMYLNGSLDSGTYNPVAYTGAILAGSADLVIGPAGVYYLHGSVQDIAIWNRALSSTEIATLYAMGDSFT